MQSYNYATLLLSPFEQSIDKSHTNEFAVAYLLEVQSTGVGVYLVCYLVDTGERMQYYYIVFGVSQLRHI